MVLEELAQSEDQPEEVALQKLLALACPDHPYGRPILGRREALLAHDPAAMASFHRASLRRRALRSGPRRGAVADGHLLEKASTGPLATLCPAAEAMGPNGTCRWPVASTGWPCRGWRPPVC